MLLFCLNSGSVLVRLFLSSAADYGNAPLEFSRICSFWGYFVLEIKVTDCTHSKSAKFWIMYVPAPLDCSGENTEFRDSKCMQSENGKEHTTGKHTGWVVLRSYPQDTYNYRSSKHSMTDGYVHYVILDTLYMLEDIHYVCLKTFPQQALPSTKRQYYY